MQLKAGAPDQNVAIWPVSYSTDLIVGRAMRFGEDGNKQLWLFIGTLAAHMRVLTQRRGARLVAWSVFSASTSLHCMRAHALPTSAPSAELSSQLVLLETRVPHPL